MPLQPVHAAEIVALLNLEIREGYAHFGTREVEPEEFLAARIDGYPALVALHDGEFAGVALASPWKSRGGYSATAELGVYLRPDHRGMGLGSALVESLIASCREAGFHTLLAGVALPNPASVRLFERAGFQAVGRLPEVGYKLGAWRDVGYWALVVGGESPSDRLQ